MAETLDVQAAPWQDLIDQRDVLPVNLAGIEKLQASRAKRKRSFFGSDHQDVAFGHFGHKVDGGLASSMKIHWVHEKHHGRRARLAFFKKTDLHSRRPGHDLEGNSPGGAFREQFQLLLFGFSRECGKNNLRIFSDSRDMMKQQLRQPCSARTETMKQLSLAQAFGHFFL